MFRLFRAFGRVFFGLVPLLGFVATLGWMLWRSNDGVAAAAQPAFIAACSLNLGFLVGRHVLAPGLDWDDEAEVAAIAAVFAAGTAP